MGRRVEVKVHKVNQAGSSSNEVSDIDVYANGTLIYTAEVKDKEFAAQDVEHAVTKVAMNDHFSLVFLKGPRGELSGDTEESLIQAWGERGFNLYFATVVDYFCSVVSVAPVIDKD